MAKFGVYLTIAALASMCAAEGVRGRYLIGKDVDADTLDFAAAPPCGHVMSSFDGIRAFSNGPDQGTGYSCGGSGPTGLRYQCVEFAQRYMHDKHGVQPIWPISYAKQMCASHPADIEHSNGANGHLVVFGFGTYGHVAVVTEVKGGRVHVVEQNSSPTGVNSYPTADVECYLKKK